ncbi:MAG: DMT family transporter [Chloroflexota bacterium]|nr:DMT family transporter [Chloroflexota bacterium]
MNSRRVALGVAMLVTFLWSTSWVLIKLGLDELELGPLSFAGLRYVLGALILLPLALPALHRAEPWRGGRRLLGNVVVLGLLVYSLTQGAQFAALAFLPAVAVALVLSTTPLLVALLSRRDEPASRLQAVGVGALVVGAALYFAPFELGDGGALGLAIALVGMVGNALAALLGRRLARDSAEQLGGVLSLTALSMLVGSLVLLGSGLIVEGLPSLAPEAWLIVGWLAVVNTALAFTLWNQTLRTLTAVESSVMNNLMLVQIAILAWVFLGEALTIVEIAGLGLAFAGILTVQLAPWLRSRRMAADLAAASGSGSAEAALSAPSGGRER